MVKKIQPIAIDKENGQPFHFPGVAVDRTIKNSTHYIVEQGYGILFVDYLEITSGSTLEILGDAAVEIT